MRLIMLLPIVLLAACSGDSQPAQQQETAAVEHIQAGQWETTSEVTKVTKRDNGEPALKMAEGSKASTQSCVAEADVKRPPSALFAPEGLTCDYRDLYMRSGRINATLSCTKTGLSGDIAIAVNGSYTGDTIEGTSTTETRLSGEGDTKIDAKFKSRRTGPCAAPTAKS